MLAVHGVTTHGYWWLPLAAELQSRQARVRLHAVCLRGRADSREVGGPYGLAAGAADLASTARRLGVRPLLVGHSMGAFVAALALARFPELFARGAVLVDGGLAMPLPGVADPAAAVEAVVRPALRRLARTYADVEAYVRDWGSHPGLRRALACGDRALLRKVALHDAVPTPTGLRCGVVAEAVRADARDLANDPSIAGAVSGTLQRGVPVELVWADRGLLDEPRGFYDTARLDQWAPARLRVTGVADANHLSVVLTDPGVAIVADAVERMGAEREGGWSG